MRVASRTILAAIFVCAVAGVSSAQQVTAVLRGTAYDPSGATVSSVTVTARQLETGFSRTATTDAQGDFVLVELPEQRLYAAVFACFTWSGLRALHFGATAKTAAG